MSDSTLKARARKAAARPPKPYAGFPPTPHAGGAGMKKIRGKIQFRTVTDPKCAVRGYYPRGSVKCKSDLHAKQVEKLAHRIFYKQRKRGEWFKLSVKHTAQIVSLIERVGAAPPETVRDFDLLGEETQAILAEERQWERNGWDRFD